MKLVLTLRGVSITKHDGTFAHSATTEQASVPQLSKPEDVCNNARTVQVLLHFANSFHAHTDIDILPGRGVAAWLILRKPLQETAACKSSATSWLTVTKCTAAVTAAQ